MSNSSDLIDRRLYKKILKSLPVVCSDILIIYKNKFLLGKRTQKPAQGQWFLPGGRIFKNETVKGAAVRKLRDELGLNAKISDLKFLKVGETIFKNSALGGSSHTINIVFTLRLKSEPKFNFDRRQHSELKWFKEVDSHWHSYVKTILRSAEF